MKAHALVLLSVAVIGLSPIPAAPQVSKNSSNAAAASPADSATKAQKSQGKKKAQRDTHDAGTGVDATTMPIGHVPKCCKPKDQSDSE
jgi:hypothetical protein